MKRIIYILYIALCCSACQLDQELDVQDMGGSPGYFIECYCNPGEMFNLTATRIASINEDQYLDYSIEFDVHITTDERFKLYHSLFNKPGTKFVYNYASSRKLDRDATDSIRLDVTTPDSSRITAMTSIPDDIKIDSVIQSSNALQIIFTTSANTAQNFYILRTDFMKDGNVCHRDIIYRDKFPNRQAITHQVKIPNIQSIDSVIIDLKRLTREGYNYQLSLKNASDANIDNITSPTPLAGNISGALGIFTCYTFDRKIIKHP